MKVRKVIEKEVPGLGAKIKQAREADPRSLVQLCREIGMSPPNWYRIENEEPRYVPLHTLRLIERVLSVDFGIDFDGKGGQNNVRPE